MRFLLLILMMLPKPWDRPPPLPPIQWEGRFGFTGRPPRNNSKFQRTIVVQECQPKRFQNWADHRDFCEYAGEITGRPEFCFTTGLQTKERCEKIIRENISSYELKGKIIYYPPDQNSN